MAKDHQKIKNKLLILFDGLCPICNSFVRFVTKINHNKKIVFCSMESELGSKIINDLNLSHISDSIVVIEKDAYYTNGQAIKKIVDKFTGIYSICKLIKLFPIFVIDFIYQIIAKNRYLIFNKYKECPVYVNREKLNIEILD